MKTRIHVNQHEIKRGRKTKEPVLPFTAKDYKQNRKGDIVWIDGPSFLVYAPDRPLSCGATAWIETDAEVRITAFGEAVE